MLNITKSDAVLFIVVFIAICIHDCIFTALKIREERMQLKSLGLFKHINRGDIETGEAQSTISLNV